MSVEEAMLPKYRNVEKMPDAEPETDSSTASSEATCILVSPNPIANPFNTSVMAK